MGRPTRVWRTVALGSVLSGILGRLAIEYDDRKRTHYVKHHLALRREHVLAQQVQAQADPLNAEHDTHQQPAWLAQLQQQQPQFPYLLSISTGDDPTATARQLLGSHRGAEVIGNVEMSTELAISELMEPSDMLGVLARAVSTKWRELKNAMDKDIPNEVALGHAKENKWGRLLDALESALEAEPIAGVKAEADSTDKEGQNSGIQGQWVLYVRDGDDILKSSVNTRRWLKFMHHVTKQGIAHVVFQTTRAVTPRVMEQLSRVNHEHSSDEAREGMIWIVLRAAHEQVDGSSAYDKLSQLNEKANLALCRCTKGEVTQSGGMDVDDVDEFEQIVRVAGNWFTDIEAICNELTSMGFSEVKDAHERQYLIHEACERVKATQASRIMKRLEIEEQSSGEYRCRFAGWNQDLAQERKEEILNTVEAWKSVAIVCGLSQQEQLLSSAQKLLKSDQSKPINCVTPVEALMPFNHRSSGEQVFLQLIEDGIIHIRPKEDVDITVWPSQPTSLLSSAWIEVSPTTKQVFEKLWRNDTLFQDFHALEQVSVQYALQEEVRIFEREIQELASKVQSKKKEFKAKKQGLSDAEQATSNAELSLMELELESKRVYLEKMRSLSHG